MRLLMLAAVAELLLLLSARAEPTSEIPFQYQDGLIWVKVGIAGKKEPRNFLLDSGASVSAIDLRTAEAYRIPLGDRLPVQGVSGPSFAYRVTDFQATVGGIPLSRSVLAVDLRTVSDRCHQNIDGIVGLDFFRNRILQVNFSSGEICVLNDCEPDLATCDILPMKMRNSTFCVPVQVAGNRELWMRLDTGCDSALECVVAGTESRRMGEPSIGVSGASTHYIKTSARLGKHRFTNVTVGIHPRQIFPGEDGLLGNGLLSKFRVTIDEPRSRLVLEKTSLPPE